MSLDLVDLIGDLRDHDRLAVALLELDLGLGAHDHGAAARAIGLADARPAQDQAGRRKVGPGDAHEEALEALVGGEVHVLEQEQEAVHHFPEVVGWDLGGHAHRDPLRAVDEQVREDGGQDHRLLAAVVVGRLEEDGVLLDVCHHRGPEAGQPGLGVAHGRGRIAVHGAEVALPVHERSPHAPVLGHAHEGVVDGAFAVRVVVAHHFARDLGALPIGPSGQEAHLLHAEEDAAVRGLQAVADVGQGPADDDGHGVVHVGLPHLVRDVGGDLLVREGLLFHIRCRGCERSRRSLR